MVTIMRILFILNSTCLNICLYFYFLFQRFIYFLEDFLINFIQYKFNKENVKVKYIGKYDRRDYE